MSHDDDSPEERRRVELKIKNLILRFYYERRSNPIFFCDELRVFVSRNGALVAPASPDRILRMLRQQGHLDYKVTDRTQSEYTFFYQEA
jgi:hypothetical protein